MDWKGSWVGRMLHWLWIQYPNFSFLVPFFSFSSSQRAAIDVIDQIMGAREEAQLYYIMIGADRERD